jgi:hypothetical protein
MIYSGLISQLLDICGDDLAAKYLLSTYVLALVVTWGMEDFARDTLPESSSFRKCFALKLA